MRVTGGRRVEVEVQVWRVAVMVLVVVRVVVRGGRVVVMVLVRAGGLEVRVRTGRDLVTGGR